MPRTHEAFQQAMSELSQSKKSRESKCESMEDFYLCGMGSNREDDGSVLQDLKSMGRDESEDTMENNFDKLKQHIGLVFSMDNCENLIRNITSLVYFVVTARDLFAVMVSYHSNYLSCKSLRDNVLTKFKVSVIHFALTARTLFAARVAHHDHDIHDWFQERSQKKQDCLSGKGIGWKTGVIDFREILTQDDGECSPLIIIYEEYLSLGCSLVILTFAMMGSVTHGCLFLNCSLLCKDQYMAKNKYRVRANQRMNVECAKIITNDEPYRRV
jgi:hypothetical protein